MNSILNINIFFSSILIFFITLFILIKMIPIFKLKLLDKPDQRSSHNKPIPTGGGIIFGIFGSFASAINGFYIPLFSLPLCFIGLIDDKYKLPALIRYISQLIVCNFLFSLSQLKTNLELNNQFILLYILIIVLSTATINFCNFIDGIDGLLISSMIIVFSTFAIDKPSLWPLISSLLAFAFLNWSPAKIFMGDSGSTYLGCIFIGCLMQFDSLILFLKGLVLITPIIGDCISCLIKRLIYRQNIFKAHKLHLYQRLNQSGWSHSKVSIIYGLGILMLCLTYITQGIIACIILSIIEIIIGFYLDKKFAKKFTINY